MGVLISPGYSGLYSYSGCYPWGAAKNSPWAPKPFEAGKEKPGTRTQASGALKPCFLGKLSYNRVRNMQNDIPFFFFVKLYSVISKSTFVVTIFL